jgi:RNA polymerase sigma-70 factor (ECF subfamily)
MKNVSFRNHVLPLKNELYRLALRITQDSAEAEDVVQETMIKVWNLRDKWDEIESIEAFCLTICRNMAVDRTRQASKKNISIDKCSSLQLPTPNSSPLTPNSSFLTPHSSLLTPEEQLEQKDRMKIVKDLIDGLPEKQRTAIHLRDIEGKSYKEIADIMDINEQQVKTNIFRARQTIKEKFTETDSYYGL